MDDNGNGNRQKRMSIVCWSSDLDRVWPVLILSTVVLFGTGVALLAVDETHGTLVGLHKASFIVWLGAAALHVLAHLVRLPRLWRLRPPGIVLRVALVTASLAAGTALATATLPGADRLQDRASAHVGLDAR